MNKIVGVALLVALLLATAILLSLGILLAVLLSIILSITDLSRWRHRMLWAVPIIGGAQILASVGVYVAGMQTSSTESVWVFLPFLAAPILFSGLILFLSPLYLPEEWGLSRRTRGVAVAALWIVFGVFLGLPGIALMGALISMPITGQQVTLGAVLVTVVCSAMTVPGGIACIVQGLRSIRHSAKEAV